MAGCNSWLVSYVKLSILIVCAYFFTLFFILKCVPIYTNDDVGDFVVKIEKYNESKKFETISNRNPYQLKMQPGKNEFFKKVRNKKPIENTEGVDFEDIGEGTTNCLSTEAFNRFRKVHENVYVYSAFYDNRAGHPFIRILSIVRKGFKSPRDTPFWCHFTIYDANSEVGNISTRLHFYELCENHKRPFGGMILSCSVPSRIQTIPDEVLVGHGDTTEKILSQSKRICVKSRNKRVNRKTLQFGVCIPPLYGNLKPSALVEFVEFNRILGANIFTMYLQESMDVVSDEVKAVLRYYESRNIINIVTWKLPVQLKQIWYHGQSLAINDCLYRNMYDFEYLIFIDLDEFLIPHSNLTSWIDVISNIAKSNPSNFENASGLIFQSSIYSEEFSRVVLSEEMSVNVLTNRTKGFSFFRNKAMIKPVRIFEMGIHHISRTWPDSANYDVIKVNVSTAHVHHYRTCVSEFGTHCKSRVEDLTVPNKYGKTLIDRYLRTLYDITP